MAQLGSSTINGSLKIDIKGGTIYRYNRSILSYWFIIFNNE